MCVVYLFMLPMKAFDITNITGVLRAGGDSRMASIIDLSCQWIIAVPLTFLTALVLGAPVAVVCLCIQSENVCKCPWGLVRLRSRKWINDVHSGGRRMTSLFPLPRLRGAAGPGGADLPLPEPAQLRHRPGGLHLPAAPQSEALRRPRG